MALIVARVSVGFMVVLSLSVDVLVGSHRSERL
jgi:hypothetical protein